MIAFESLLDPLRKTVETTELANLIETEAELEMGSIGPWKTANWRQYGDNRAHRPHKLSPLVSTTSGNNGG